MNNRAIPQREAGAGRCGVCDAPLDSADDDLTAELCRACAQQVFKGQAKQHGSRAEQTFRKGYIYGRRAKQNTSPS